MYLSSIHLTQAGFGINSNDKNKELDLQTTICVQIEDVAGAAEPQVFEFQLDSMNLVFLPNVGDTVVLPGMEKSITVTGRDFVYAAPDSLTVWLDFED